MAETRVVITADADQAILEFNRLRSSATGSMQQIGQAGEQLNRAGISAGQLRAAMAGLPAQINDVVVSLQGGQAPMTVLLQQGSQIVGQFGGSVSSALRGVASYAMGLVNPLTVAAAAGGVLALAWYNGNQEAEAFRKTLILTGNAAGTTTSQLTAMSAAVAASAGDTKARGADAVNQLLATGRVGKENLQQLATASVLAQKDIGIAVGDTVKTFEDLAKSPVETSEKLTEKYHYLTLGTYRQIKALQDQGLADDAARVAQSAYAEAITQRSKDVNASLGYLEKGWNAVGSAAHKAWDWMLDVGREDTFDEKMAKAQAKLEKAKKARMTFVGAGRDGKKDLDDAQAGVDALNKQKKADEDKAKAQEESNRLNEAGIALAKEWEKYLPRQAQLKRDLAAAETLVRAAAKPDQSAAETEKQIADLQLEVRKKYSDIFNAGIDGQIEAIKRRGSIEDMVVGRSAATLAAYQQAGLATSLSAEESYLSAQESIDQARILSKRKVLEEELKLTTGKANSEKDQAALRGQLAELDIESISRRIKLTDDLFVLEVKSTRAAANSTADMLDKRDAEARALEQQIQSQRDENAMIGLSKKEVMAYRSGLVELTAARKDDDAAVLETIPGREGEAKRLRDSAAAMRELAQAQAIGTMKADDFEQQRQRWESIAQAGEQTFISIGEQGKKTFDRLTETLKSGLLSALWQATAKPWILSIGAELSGYSGIAQGAVGANGAASAGSSALSALSTGSSLYSLSSSGSLSTSFGASSLGQFYSGFSGSAGAASQALGAPMTTSAGAGQWVSNGLSGTAGTPYLGMAGGGLVAYNVAQNHGALAGAAAGAGTIAAGGALAGAASGAAAGTGVLAGAGSGAMSALAAIPGWGWAALAALAIGGSLFGGDGPEQNTRLTFTSNNAAGNISINERGNEGKNDAYIAGSGSSAFGTFGVSSTFWAPAESETVQSFIKTVSQTDDALAAFLTTSEKANVTSYLTGKSATAQTGAEGNIADAGQELSKVFADRINNILEGVEPGLSKLEANFSGTSQELATEVAALLEYRSALRDSGEAVFGAKVTLQDVAALKLPTEATSVALTRIANEFTATNQVAQILGKDMSTAFGSAGLASEAARAQIILLSGGLSNFTTLASSFAQNYLTDAERLAPVAKQLDAQLAALGLVSIPQTKDEFKALVSGLDLSSESGQKLYAGLMNLQDAFAQVHATEKSAAEVLSEHTDLQRQLDELMLTQTQLAEKARSAISAQNQALYDQVQAAQAAKDATTTLSDNVNSAYSLVQDVAARDREKLNAAYQTAVDGIQTSIDNVTSAVNKLDGLSQSLHSTLDSLSTSGDDLADRQKAQAQIATAVAIAKAGGPLPDADSLKGALSTLGKDASGQFATYLDYQRDLYRTKNSLTDLSVYTDTTLSVEQKHLATLQDQKKMLEEAHKEDLERLDASLELARESTDFLGGIHAAAITLPQALATLTATVAAAKANGTIDSTAGLAGLYQSVLGRAPDAAGYAFWEDRIAHGASLDAVKEAMLASSEYKSLHPFDVGTNYVPGDMPALIHEGERIVPAADNRELMARLRSPVGDNSELIAELRAARAENASMSRMLESHLYAIAKYTLGAKDLLDGAVNGDVPLATKAVEVTA